MRFVFVLPVVLFLADATGKAEGPLRLEVSPTKVELTSRRATSQIVVTGQFADGETRDLTATATYRVADPAVATVANGVITPSKTGVTTLIVTAGKQSLTVPVQVSGLDKPDPIRFRTETLAALTKQGCNSGSCHGSPQGKGGFSLSLFGYDPIPDAEALVRGGLSRRVNALAPDDSLLLKKPLLRVAHVGGKKLAKADAAYHVLHDWIAEGAKTNDEGGPTCTKIIIHPGAARVLKAPYLSQQLGVVAHFSDGSTRDVTPIATYDISDKEIVAVGANGLVTGQKRGQAAVSVRYLEHLASVHFTVVEDVPGFIWASEPAPTEIDRHVNAKLQQLKVLPSPVCDDATFIRRVHLDLTGLLPTVSATRAFLADSSADKRAKLIDTLIDSEEFARCWAQRSADLMRVHPRVLKDGRAEEFARWLVSAYRSNMPADKFATAILTASGDTKQNPAANYFLGIPVRADLTESTAQVFMGSRINCAKCHNHPFENWTQTDYYRIQAVFARVELKNNQVLLTTSGEVTHPASGKVLTPWGGAEGKADRRVAFAKWLTAAGNPFFARVEANRIWSHLLGRGIVHPVDDFRSSNPSTNPELLDALAAEFEKTGYDRKRLIKAICNSRAYQRSAATNPFNEADDKLFSHARVRRLSAEQIQDGIGYTTETLRPTSALTDAIVKAEKDVADKPTDKGKQTALRHLKDRTEYATQRLFPEETPFLRAFGQPPRESPCACERADDPTVDQALELLNGRAVADRLNRGAATYAKLTDEALVDQLYLAALCRFPTENERAKLKGYLAKPGERRDRTQDVIWAILNTREFLFQH